MAALTRIAIGAPYSLNATTTAGFQTFALDGNTDALEWIVQAPEAAVITHVGFRYGARTGTPPTYRISIQGVGTDGNPDGTIKGGGSPASATFTPPASTAWNSLWQWVQLSNSYTVARGEFIALVIDYSSGTINGSNNGSFTSSITGHGGGRTGFPYAIHNDATVRTRQANESSYGYKSSTVTYGVAWQTVNLIAFSSNSNPNEYALAFVMPAGVGSSFQVVGVRAVITTPAAGKSFDVRLYEGTTVLQDVTIDSDALRLAATGAQIVEIYFNEVTLSTLKEGTTYYIAFAPLDTSNNMAITSWSAASAQDARAVGGDGNLYLATRNGGAWSPDTATRPALELLLASMTSGANRAALPSGLSSLG